MSISAVARLCAGFSISIVASITTADEVGRDLRGPLTKDWVSPDKLADAGLFEATFKPLPTELLNVRDPPYAAKCDGATDDTNAFIRIFSDAAKGRKVVYVPAGTCLVSGLEYPSLPYAQQFNIMGDGRNVTKIKQVADSATKPVLTIGSPAATNFTADLRLQGITLDARDRNQPALVSYDLVRSRIQDVAFTNGSIGYMSYGGINNVIEAHAHGNSIGARFMKFASMAAGGWPNHIRWHGAITDNFKLGLDIDYARSFTCESCDIEGNGTMAGAEGEGGIKIGNSMGTELASVGDTIGFVCRSCWFESNKGRADVTSASGTSIFDASSFASAPNQTTYDMHFTGGTYVLIGSTGAYQKITLKDEPAVSAGYIIGSYLPHAEATKICHHPVFYNFGTSRATDMMHYQGERERGLCEQGLNLHGSLSKIAFCGDGARIVGTDRGGTVTVGSGNPSGCTILFASSHRKFMSCTVTSRTAAQFTYRIANDGIIIAAIESYGLRGGVFDYMCASN